MRLVCLLLVGLITGYPGLFDLPLLLSASSHNMERHTAPCADNEANGFRTIILSRDPFFYHWSQLIQLSVHVFILQKTTSVYVCRILLRKVKLGPWLTYCFTWCNGFAVAPSMGWAFYYGWYSWSTLSCFAMLSGQGIENDRLPHTLSNDCRPTHQS